MQPATQSQPHVLCAQLTSTAGGRGNCVATPEASMNSVSTSSAAWAALIWSRPLSGQATEAIFSGSHTSPACPSATSLRGTSKTNSTLERKLFDRPCEGSRCARGVRLLLAVYVAAACPPPVLTFRRCPSSRACVITCCVVAVAELGVESIHLVIRLSVLSLYLDGLLLRVLVRIFLWHNHDKIAETREFKKFKIHTQTGNWHDV